VTSAGVAKAAGVIVYSIAYTAQADTCQAAIGADVNGTIITSGSPRVETPAISPLTALSGIATDPTNFYNLPTPSSLTTIFRRIAADLAAGSSRIVQ